MFRFLEGASVALKEDAPSLELDAGTTGVIWALYKSIPPSYEVTFVGRDGKKFDVTMSGDELTVPAGARELSGAQRFTPNS